MERDNGLQKTLGGAMSMVMATTRATARALNIAVTLTLSVGCCNGCIYLEDQKALDHY